MIWRRYLSLLGLVVMTRTTQAHDLELAWLRDGNVHTPVGKTTVDVETPRRPLGSLWKLFVYAYAVDADVPMPAYRCAASRQPGEEYCCEPAQSVERDAALLKSCALFFEPKRLKIAEAKWRDYWQERAGDEAPWLLDLSTLQPATQLSVTEILRGIQAIAPAGRTAAEKALMPMTVTGAGKTTLGSLGGVLRVKTFTWSDPEAPQISIGGAAGWLVDGTPVWFTARGSSKTVLRTHAQALAQSLPPLTADSAIDASCVVVDYFERYPIKSVDSLPSGAPTVPGPLKGNNRITFENGNTLTFTTRGGLVLADVADRPFIQGRHTFNDYVARVIDREAKATPVEAARALAVVIRTYTIQNAKFENGCYRIADSTRKQRVSANDPSPPAREIALFTDGLMLDVDTVRYHAELNVPGVLGWRSAVAQATAGQQYDAILASAFPGATLAAISGERDCRRLPNIESWYGQAVRRWNQQLANEPGFEPLTRMPTICALDTGNPYSDQERLRIYLRELRTRDDRIALAHEYLHLAFRFHPRGEDESFIEHTARKLVD